MRALYHIKLEGLAYTFPFIFSSFFFVNLTVYEKEQLALKKILRLHDSSGIRKGEKNKVKRDTNLNTWGNNFLLLFLHREKEE